MTKTMVRRHPRKKPLGGTTTVKRHPRTIKQREVPQRALEKEEIQYPSLNGHHNLPHHPTLYRGADWGFLNYELERGFGSDYSPFSVSFTDNLDVAKDFYSQKEWNDQDTDTAKELKGVGVLVEVKENALIKNDIVRVSDIPKDDYISRPDLIDHVWQEGEFSDPFMGDFPDYFFEQLQDFDNLLGKDLDNWGKYSVATTKDKQEILDTVREFREWKQEQIEEYGTVEDNYEFMDYWEGFSPRLMRIDKAYSIAQGESEYITMKPPRMTKDNMIIHVKTEAQREYILNQRTDLKKNVKINNIF